MTTTTMHKFASHFCISSSASLLVVSLLPLSVSNHYFAPKQPNKINKSLRFSVSFAQSRLCPPLSGGAAQRRQQSCSSHLRPRWPFLSRIHRFCWRGHCAHGAQNEAFPAQPKESVQAALRSWPRRPPAPPSIFNLRAAAANPNAIGMEQARNFCRSIILIEYSIYEQAKGRGREQEEAGGRASGDGRRRQRPLHWWRTSACSCRRVFPSCRCRLLMCMHVRASCSSLAS